MHHAMPIIQSNGIRRAKPTCTCRLLHSDALAHHRLSCPPTVIGAWRIRRVSAYLQGGERTKQEELAEEQYQAVVPLLPARTDASMKEYWRFYLTSVSAIIIFGGLLAPVLEVKMGLGGAGLPLSARV